VVRVVVKLIGVEGRRLLFEAWVYYKGRVVGEGQHERYIVEVERFLERVRRIQSE
jgi:predicted thioesterase